MSNSWPVKQLTTFQFFVNCTLGYREHIQDGLMGE